MFAKRKSMLNNNQSIHRIFLTKILIRNRNLLVIRSVSQPLHLAITTHLRVENRMKTILLSTMMINS